MPPLSNMFKQVSTRSILLFLAVGMGLALTFGGFVASQLSGTVTDQARDRELSFLFGSIESGPLAIARLQAAEIAQQQLSRLMENDSLKERGIRGVRILGGPDLSFAYATWSPAEGGQGLCVQEYRRKFSFPDALNDFLIEIQRDECFTVSEQKLIAGYSLAAGLLIALLATGFVLVAVWPVALSIRLAESAFRNKFKSVSRIPFSPIRSLVDQAIRSFELEREQTLITVAQQVAHDIRSPVSALKIAVEKIPEQNSEEVALIKAAANRIEAISQDLISQRHAIQKSDKVTSGQDKPVLDIVKGIIAEKKVQLKEKQKLIEDFKIATGRSVRMNATDLSRVLSNLINNSIEAIHSDGEITISLRDGDRHAEIVISDSGKGIPAEILERLGHQQITHGKNNPSSGSGLGLKHARSTIESAGGTLTITSKVGIGTMVRLILPLA